MRIAAALLLTVPLAGCVDVDERSMQRPIVVEERDGLWLRSDGTPPRRVTALRVAGFDYDSLAARQREGAVILYWAAAPVLSPDGRTIAYASNREAVASGTNGQSIWLVHLDDGSERALLHEPGHSLRPVGWFGDDVVVFIGDRPGVWGVDIAGADARLLAPGTFVAAAEDGSALAVADGVPDDVTLRVLTRDGAVDVPAAALPFEYLAQGSFSADGRVLRLEAAADSGFRRRRYEYDLVQHSIMAVD